MCTLRSKAAVRKSTCARARSQREEDGIAPIARTCIHLLHRKCSQQIAHRRHTIEQHPTFDEAPYELSCRKEAMRTERLLAWSELSCCGRKSWISARPLGKVAGTRKWFMPRALLLEYSAKATACVPTSQFTQSRGPSRTRSSGRRHPSRSVPSACPRQRA